MKNADRQRPVAAPIRAAEPTPFDIISIIRRRIFLILGVAAVTVALSIAYLMSLTPRYVADAQILLGEQGLSSRSTFDFLESQALSNSVIEGELAVLRSGALLVRVSNRLRLNDTPEFNSDLRPPERPMPVMSQLREALSAARAMLPLPGRDVVDPTAQDTTAAGSSVISAAAAAGDPLLRENDDIIGKLNQKISVRQLGGSFVVQVSVGSEDPVMAAAIANTLMEEYIGFLTDKRFKAAQRFTNWLELRVAELAVKLEEAERDALAFRSKMETGADSRERLDQQISEMTSKIVDARTALAVATAQAARTATVAERDGPLAASDILSSDEIMRYRTELGDLRREAATAAINFGEGSLQTVSISRAMAKIEDSIAVEVSRAVTELRNRAEVSASVVVSLEDTLAAIETLVLSRSSDEIKLNQLQRIADANRRVYEEFLGRFKETSEIQNLRSADAEVISYASPPPGAAYPRKKVGVVLAAAGGIFAGLALAFMLELSPARIADAGHLSRMTGLPIYAQIPRLSAKTDAFALLRALDGRPDGPLGSAARRLLNNVDSSASADGNVIMMAGVRPGRTKSDIALMLGWAVTQTGRTCIVVDADTRAARLTNGLGLKPTKSASKGALPVTVIDVLYDNAAANQAMRALGSSGLHVMTCRATGSDPALVFNTTRARDLIENLMDTYDTVIIDAPVITDASDSLMLPVKCDICLVVAEAQRTVLSELETGLKILEDSGIDRIGAVMSNVKSTTKAGA